jgi:hypothetical protein
MKSFRKWTHSRQTNVRQWFGRGVLHCHWPAMEVLSYFGAITKAIKEGLVIQIARREWIGGSTVGTLVVTKLNQ